MHERRPPESEYVAFPDEGGRNWRQEYLEIPLMLLSLGLPRSGRVLEIGCGRGNALGAIARGLAPAQLVGMDINPEFIQVAKHTKPVSPIDLNLVVADVAHLPFHDASFDLVIDFGTCFHVPQPAAALNEIARVTKLDGLFVTEMKLSQILSHPVRTRGRFLPWDAVPELVPLRRALLWESRRKISV